MPEHRGGWHRKPQPKYLREKAATRWPSRKVLTKGEQVGTAIKLLSQCLFRRHVYDRAHGSAGTGQVTRRLSRHALRIVLVDFAAAAAAQLVLQRQLRQPEVENFGVATVGDENVRRLYVSMDNAMRMRSI